MTFNMHKSLNHLLSITAAIFFSQVSQASQAQPAPLNTPIETTTSDIQFVPEPPPDQGAPDGRQRGGGTRGDCLAYQGLTALVPQVEGIVWSQTAIATPSLFFHVPADLNEAIPLELVIQDSSDDYVFRKQFSANAAAGTLAVSAGGLQPDELYTWTFSIYCDAQSPSNLVYVSGTIERRADVEVISFSADASSAEKLEALQQYAAQGIWQEAIALAIDLFYTKHNDSSQIGAFSSLLEQIGLSDLSLTNSLYETP